MSELAKAYERSRIPLYVQLAGTLRQRIERGIWREGDKISTLEQLQKEFEVARVTVRQAIELLQNEGLVERWPGKGTFVAHSPPDRRWLHVRANWRAMMQGIAQQRPRLLDVDIPPQNPRLRQGDGEPAEEYVYIRSVQSRNNQPFAIVGVHLERHYYELAPEDFRHNAVLPLLDLVGNVAISRAHQTLTISTADPETAALLEIALNDPVAEAHCVINDKDGTAIYVAEITYRGDCLRLDIDLLGNGHR